MLTQEQIDQALSTNGRIVQIGQISPASVRRLNKRAKAGELIKSRCHWHYVSGFGLGPLKSVWSLSLAGEVAA